VSDRRRKPEWLKIRIRNGAELAEVREVLDRLSLRTVCGEADCPNLMECFGAGTATFMILGGVCTRNCRFCKVGTGLPEPPDPGEGARVAEAVRALGLSYAVVTSVTRDDLPDGGAVAFAATIAAIKARVPGAAVEVLIPDFRGDAAALLTVLAARPDVVNHNLETVARLYPEVRPQAVYGRSLELVRRIKELSPTGGATDATADSVGATPVLIFSKSGLMVGLGETFAEVVAALRDLREVGCDFLTIGQYLPPSKDHHPVIEYVRPEAFEEYRRLGMEMGFRGVAAGPLVRSSYRAGELAHFVGRPAR
jgi:lipoyl synthase